VFFESKDVVALEFDKLNWEFGPNSGIEIHVFITKFDRNLIFVLTLFYQAFDKFLSIIPYVHILLTQYGICLGIIK